MAYEIMDFYIDLTVLIHCVFFLPVRKNLYQESSRHKKLAKRILVLK